MTYISACIGLASVTGGSAAVEPHDLKNIGLLTQCFCLSFHETAITVFRRAPDLRRSSLDSKHV